MPVLAPAGAQFEAEFRERPFVAAQKHPIGGEDAHPRIGRAATAEARHAVMIGQACHDTLQPQVAIADVHRQNTIGLQMPQIDREGLASQQMRRYGVAAESVQHQNVESLRRLSLQ